MMAVDDSQTVSSQPVLPKYGSWGISGLIPTLLAPHGAGVEEWIPGDIYSGRPVVLLVIDGLGWNQLQARATLTPTMGAMSAIAITSVAPTTTATALTSIATGLTPAEHGLLGYRIDMGGTAMNVLRWTNKKGDCRDLHPPRQVQPCPPFMGAKVPVISKGELTDTGFTNAHLFGAHHVGWRAMSSIAVEINHQLRDGQKFIYAYYDGVDKIAHERGFGDYFDAEIRNVDQLVSDVLKVMPTGSTLLVTADHGQVEVGDAIIEHRADLLALVHHQSGEGRFRWLHAKPGATEELLAACGRYLDVAWVVSKEQILDDQWFGRAMPTIHQQRLGDVALIARANVTFDDPEENGPFVLVCRHGSLTEDEMLVPLLSATL